MRHFKQVLVVHLRCFLHLWANVALPTRWGYVMVLEWFIEDIRAGCRNAARIPLLHEYKAVSIYTYEDSMGAVMASMTVRQTLKSFSLLQPFVGAPPPASLEPVVRHSEVEVMTRSCSIDPTVEWGTKVCF